MKKFIKNLFTVTPKEWVAVQAFCITASGAITAGWNGVVNVFGTDNSGTVENALKILIGVFAAVAFYAQTKTKKK